MSSDRINANPEDVRKLASALTQYQKDVASQSSRVRAALRSAEWEDARKAQFEASLQDLQRSIDRFLISEVEQMVRRLNELARRLEDVRDVRM